MFFLGEKVNVHGSDGNISDGVVTFVDERHVRFAARNAFKAGGCEYEEGTEWCVWNDDLGANAGVTISHQVNSETANLLDLFAMRALAVVDEYHTTFDVDAYAADAYLLAQAMLKARPQ